jgi:hypothetical protein
MLTEEETKVVAGLENKQPQRPFHLKMRATFGAVAFATGCDR